MKPYGFANPVGFRDKACSRLRVARRMCEPQEGRGHPSKSEEQFVKCPELVLRKLPACERCAYPAPSHNLLEDSEVNRLRKMQIEPRMSTEISILLSPVSRYRDEERSFRHRHGAQ